MINNIKLWLNRHKKVIIKYCIIFVIILLFPRIMNNNWLNSNKNNKNSDTAKNENSLNTTNTQSSYASIGDNTDNFEKVESSDEKYEIVNNIVSKILGYLKDVNLNQGNKEVAKKLISVMTTRYAAKIAYANRYNYKFNLYENVYKYVLQVSDVNDWNVKDIYKYSYSNGIYRYVVKLNYLGELTMGMSDTAYIIINVDFNNKVFSYEGDMVYLKDLKNRENVSQIEINDYNKY